jgi:hypothetical protein
MKVWCFLVLIAFIFAIAELWNYVTKMGMSSRLCVSGRQKMSIAKVANHHFFP